MTPWLRRIRGAVLMGLIWAAAWAPVGVLIGMILDPDGSMDEPWVLIGAYPGFICGVIFSVVLGIAARRRKLHELSVPRVGAWGAVAGLMMGVIPFLIGDSNGERSLWLLGVVFTSSTTLLSAGSAAGSLVLAKRANKRELLDASADVVEVGPL
jgi:hypothetical protein